MSLTGPLLYIGMALTVILGIGFGVMEVRIILLQSSLAAARLATAEAENVASRINEIVSRNEAEREKARAEDALKANEEMEQLRRAAAIANARYNAERVARIKASQEAQRIIDNGLESDRALIGNTMSRYFICVRQQQQGAGDCSTSAGNP